MEPAISTFSSVKELGFNTAETPMDAFLTLEGRTSDLEKKVRDQHDEILCLRATLADVLRRMSVMESARGYGSVKDAVRLRADLADTSATNSPAHSNSPSRDVVRRPNSTTCFPSSGGRRSILNHSTGSLASDCFSSNSVSPAPSPSPTQNHQVHLREHKSASEHHRRSTLDNGSVDSANSSFTSTINNGMQSSKRWSSTSDFASHGTMSAKKLNSSSLLNLTRNSTVASKIGCKPVYNADEGTVKMYFHGRPVSILLPTPLRDSYHLQIGTTPQTRLNMEWVYGYRGKDSRSNLYVLPTGEMVYFVASIVVLFNSEEGQQRHYLGHTDEVKCLVVHPNRLLIASGQSAGSERKAHVRIWNSVSLQTLHVIGLNEFTKSIAMVAFSKTDGGSHLVIIDDGPDHNLSLWECQKNEKVNKIVETKCSSDLVLAVEFHPIERHSFVTCGKGHVCFWSFENGSISRKFGLIESRDKPKYVTCLTFTENGDLITGDSNGTICAWARGSNTILKTVRNAHEGPIFSLLCLNDGYIVSGGGKDGQLLLWDPAGYRRTGYVAEVDEIYGKVRTIAQGKGNQILLGTTKNCILAGSFELPFTPLILGHTDELWSLCVHPIQNQFLSGGSDNRVQLWDTMSHSHIWSKQVDSAIKSASFSPDGSTLILATVYGKWIAIDSDTRELFATHSDGKEPLQVVKFSPNGKFLAIGSRDSVIYIYQVLNQRSYNRIGRCTGHSSGINHLDWSTNSLCLASSSEDYETLYWNVEVCRQMTQDSQIRDIEWHSVTSTCHWSTIGIWPEGGDTVDINSCCTSSAGNSLVTGDGIGRVKLFNHPAHARQAPFREYCGHAGPISNVCFLQDDTRLLTSGRRDATVIQWTVELE